jgi:CDP-diacylglycerol--glycerol-3-phosphate 3-phosphatidyltransferase
MKAADKLSALRIILAPVFFIVYSLPAWIPGIFRFFAPGHDVSGLSQLWTIPVLWLIFIVAELTDMFDGMVARKRGETSDFGRLFDPFADTLVQLTFLLCFVIEGILPAFLYIIVIYREFAILFIRNLMLKKGITMGARMGGKIKTVAYISACALSLLALSLHVLGREDLAGLVKKASQAVFVIAVILAVVSFFDYYKVYRAES